MRTNPFQQTLCRWIAVFALGVCPAAARADDRHYMLIFAYQGTPVLPRTAHTFATFVRAAGDKDRVIETHTISWLPASLAVRPIRALPEPGRNLNLDETLKVAKSMNARIALWGPYRIDKELYERALKQIERLNRGAVSYKAVDAATRPDGALNCFHAVSDLDTERGLLATGTAFGEAASAMVASHLRRWIIQPDQTHPWLIDRLGLKNDELQVRDLARGEQPAPLLRELLKLPF